MEDSNVIFGYHIKYIIKGFNVCVFSSIEIEIKNSDTFSKLKLNKKDEVCEGILFFKKGLNTSGVDEGKWVSEGENIVRSLAIELIDKGYPIYELDVFCLSASYPFNEERRMCKSTLMLRSIQEEEKKEIESFDFSNKQVPPSNDKIFDALKIEDGALRFNTLYGLLHGICGSQDKVKKLIEEKYKIKYDIKCSNLNKDGEKYGKSNQLQDDFSYLRTICSHIDPSKDNSEELIREYNERIQRDTNKIVKILLEECKNG